VTRAVRRPFTPSEALFTLSEGRASFDRLRARPSRRARWLALVALVALVAAAAPAAAEPWRASLEVGGEVDTNVRRISVTPGGRQAETAPLVRAVAELARRGKAGEHTRWALRLAGGARAVVAGAVVGEDLLIGSIDVAAERDGPGDDVALLARVTHYDVVPVGGENGARAFASSGADLGLRLVGGEGRAATLTAGVRRLDYKPDPDFDWLGQAATVRVTDELWREADERWLELAVAYRIERRGYRGRAFTDGCAPGEPRTPACFVPTGEPRTDLQHVSGAELTYTGGAVLSATYQLVFNDSASFGSSYVRHRVILSATRALGRAWFATATVTGQLDHFRDPLLVTDDLNMTFTSIDDENRSGAAVRVARAVGEAWELEARYAFQADASGGDDLTYRRHLVYAGLTWERD